MIETSLSIHLSFAEFVVTAFRSKRTSKTNNQNSFECILMTGEMCSNGLWLFDFNQIKLIVQIVTNSVKT